MALPALSPACLLPGSPLLPPAGPLPWPRHLLLLGRFPLQVPPPPSPSLPSLPGCLTARWPPWHGLAAGTHSSGSPWLEVSSCRLSPKSVPSLPAPLCQAETETPGQLVLLVTLETEQYRLEGQQGRAVVTLGGSSLAVPGRHGGVTLQQVINLKHRVCAKTSTPPNTSRLKS